MEEKTTDFIKELITFAIIAIVIVVPIRFFVAKPFIVNGDSMYPTFETGNYLIVDQLSYRFNEPERGDVIIFKFPENTSKFFIKRIIGLPGETVIIEGTDVYILKEGSKERELLNEDFITLNRDTFVTKKLSEDEFFVMGDNRLASLDSRAWGPLNKDYIIGRAYVRLLPFNKIGVLPGSIEYDYAK